MIQILIKYQVIFDRYFTTGFVGKVRTKLIFRDMNVKFNKFTLSNALSFIYTGIFFYNSSINEPDD